MESCLIGGLVALINPLAGAAVAMKSLMPSIAMLLSKYGLKYAGEAANARELTQRLKAAEKDVLRQFRGVGPETVVNPLLTHLDHALDTSESQYEPIADFDSDKLDFGKRDRERLFRLSCQAITNTYDDAIQDQSCWEAASLGPEDIRFLELLRDLASGQAD